MQHLDEGTIHAWLDGALPPNEGSAAEAHVQVCEQCAQAVAEARGLIAASSRILGALDDVPAVQGSAATLSLPAARARHTSWWRRAGIGYAAAATALLAVGTTLVWSRLSPDTAMQSAAQEADYARRAAEPASARTITDSLASSRVAESAPSARETQPANEELAKDLVVPLPGEMPRVSRPSPAAPPVRQEGERKALGAMPGEAKARPAQVLGRVLDAATGAPVVGARVSIDTARVIASTDSAGRFELQSVPLGKQTVRVRALGFQPAQHPVAVVANDSVQLAFALRRSVLQLEQVVQTNAAASAQQDRREAESARRDAGQARVAGQEVRLGAVSPRSAAVAGCYDLRTVSRDQVRETDRDLIISLPKRVQLERDLVDRSRASSASRARTLSGTARAQSWRMAADSLEITFVDGDRRYVLRLGRVGAGWVSSLALLEPCSVR